MPGPGTGLGQRRDIFSSSLPLALGQAWSTDLLGARGQRGHLAIAIAAMNARAATYPVERRRQEPAARTAA